MKKEVKEHWEREVCGTRYDSTQKVAQALDPVEEARYLLEPFIPRFAGFESSAGKNVLEIGVGAGVDFSQWVRNGAKAVGIDLTDAAINETTHRLNKLGIPSSCYQLNKGDAERLSFDDNSFDIVYSYGVLHHSPNTEKALGEVFRVLRPGGVLRGMVYHVPSLVGWMLWFRYSLGTGRVLSTPRDAIFRHLESPGTKSYTMKEFRAVLKSQQFVIDSMYTKLSCGDLLLNKPSPKYQNPFYAACWALYPRWIGKLLGDRFGLFLLFEARKPFCNSN